ncbi:hypothetical protein GUITHDRAFT_135562 [Guillardia theta CCMP2712]|uniref:Sushi domain-containing protein n=1 Tax=Guillardia theta (strain CCMP2712) TaxID=905079 RepID=L1JP84_GUITC|nr:hypothetical protein GUITHDRAFT_135562 [Guillardia theta CCMP2712]EKX49863.1 hypothetical protein GUITHDRAFT_135562 [Guillardia theta CCMP2712]|eukprot:XP_005836843.1 hypothetical protein GUITHDRAFT_135562 [Guillardia theta CCMP2712]
MTFSHALMLYCLLALLQPVEERLSVQCRANSTFASTSFQTLRNIPLLANGTVSPSTGVIPIGSSLLLLCNKGFRLTGPGSPVPKCLSSCSFELGMTCEMVRCPPFVDAFGDSALMNRSLLYGESMTVTCKPGYRSSASLPTGGFPCSTSYTKLCSETGQLEDASTHCVPVTCPRYDAGSDSLKCLTSDCGPAEGTIIAAVTDPAPATFTSTKEIVCNAGYDRVDAGKSPRCNETCQYSNNSQACRPLSCPLPDLTGFRMEFEQGVTGSIPYLSTVSLSCFQGFVFQSSSGLSCVRSRTLTCSLVDGSRTELTPAISTLSCSPLTCPPLNLSHAQYSKLQDPMYGQTVDVVCDRGYALPSSGLTCDKVSSFTAQCFDCSFRLKGDGSPVSCNRAPCPAFPHSILNGHLARAGVIYPGETTKIDCEVGTQLGQGGETSLTVSCLSNCSWDLQRDVTCYRKMCPALVLPANSQIERAVSYTSSAIEYDAVTKELKMYHNDSIIVKCNSGYMVDARPDDARFCKTTFNLSCFNGSFVGMSKCVPYQCGCGFGLPCERFNQDTNALPLPSYVDSGKLVEVRCKDGYRAAQSGSKYATCSDPSGYSLLCSDCSYNSTSMRNQVSASRNSSSDSAGVVPVDSTILVVCDEGFRAMGSQSRQTTVKCTSTCQFNVTQACLPIFCNSSTIKDGKAIPTNNSSLVQHNTEVFVSCNQGYHVPGPSSCNTNYTALCYDGMFVSSKTCVAITTSDCGCGIGACRQYQLRTGELNVSPNISISHGSLARVECAPGFRASPVSSSTPPTCQASREFNFTCNDCKLETDMACSPAVCRFYNGSDQAVTLSCPFGFRAFSSDRGSSSSYTATCSDTCSFLPSSTDVCRPIRCPPLFLGNLFASSNQSQLAALYHGDSLNVSCLPGYQIQGSRCQTWRTVTCQDGQLPSVACEAIACNCSASTCRGPEDEGALTVNLSSPLLNRGRTNVTCKEGFRAAASNASSSSCSLPRWYPVECVDCSLQTAASCKRVSCGPVRMVGAEARVLADPVSGEVLYNESVTYSCPLGHRLYDRNADSSSSITFHCEADCSYTNSSSSLSSSSSSLSSSSSSICYRVSCEELTALPNASVKATGGGNLTGLLFGDEVEVTCDGQLVSLQHLQQGRCVRQWNVSCNDQGKFDRSGCSLPTCECGGTACGLLSLPSLHVNLSSLPAPLLPSGGSVYARCPQGYRATSPNNSSSSCSDDAQVLLGCRNCSVAADKICAPVLCSLSFQDDNLIWINSSSSSSSSASAVFQQVIAFTCRPGFRPASSSCSSQRCPARSPNSSFLTCQQDCQFAPPSPRCLPVTCNVSDLAVPRGSISDGRQVYRSGENLTVVCDAGYMSEENSRINSKCDKSFTAVCNLDGTWSAASRCSAIRCNVSYYRASKLVELGGKLDCGKGYISDVEDALVCKDDCSINSTLPCRPRECPVVEVTNASVVGRNGSLNVLFGDLVTYKCNDGLVVSRQFEMFAKNNCSDEFTVMCQDNGTLQLVSSFTSVCLPPSCPPYFTLDSLVEISNSTTSSAAFGSTMNLTCRQGSRFDSSPTVASAAVTCGGEGEGRCSWSKAPRCVPITCRYSPPANSLLLDVNATLREHPIGSRVAGKCIDGYQTTASSNCSSDFENVCQQTGEFSSTQCLPAFCPPYSQQLRTFLSSFNEAALGPFVLPPSPLLNSSYNTSLLLSCPLEALPLNVATGQFLPSPFPVSCSPACSWDRIVVCKLISCSLDNLPLLQAAGFNVEQGEVVDGRVSVRYNHFLNLSCGEGEEVVESAGNFIVPDLPGLGYINVYVRQTFSGGHLAIGREPGS